ncbi:hypothetical protein SAMN04487957_110107 [Halomonas shengliensis]|uniref:Uncharacterized protein n=1 Tax=Halomonas shengliensis TaxID=419597 RepID=A0A1H0LUJ6_9GAMM|nr:hypothetical protein SAMN04487957_110107 [Halomonas shengliensis]
MLPTHPSRNRALLNPKSFSSALLGSKVLDESFDGLIHVLRAR